MPRAILAAVLVVLVNSMPSSALVGSGKIGISAAEGIYTMNVDGSDLRLIRAAPFSCGQPCTRPTPRWSPDGSLIAFVDNGGTHVMDSTGGQVRTISNGAVDLGPQAWSPDSHELVSRNGVFSVEDGTWRTLVNEPVSNPAWSPTGTVIAYVRGTGDLRLVDSAGGTPRTIVSGQVDGHPVWSPDGRHLAFLQSAGAMSYSLWVVDSDGAGLRQVDGALGYIGWPAWSPDGRRLLFTKQFSYDYWTTPSDVFSADFSTLAETQLTFDSFAARSSWGAAWSPDGSWITTQRAEGGRAMNPDGTCARDFSGARGELFWQPLPESPPLPRYTCHALRVTARVKPVGRASVDVEIAVANSGTEPLSGVRLRQLSGTDFTPTAVRSSRASCSLRHGPGLCRVGSLRVGESVLVRLRADVRRVTNGQWGLLRISAHAHEPLTDPQASSFSFAPYLRGCWTKTPGGGLILGSEFGELICGRRGPDWIEPYAGTDRVRAGAGNDVVFVRDNERDVVSCGLGRDLVYADYADKVDRDCERVRRA